MTAASPHHAPSSDTRLFMERLFGDEPLDGLIEVRAWPAERERVVRVFCANVTDAEREIGRFARQRLNVFVGVALRRSAGNGTKANLASARALWIDVDDLADVGAREDFAIRLERFPLPPTLRIWSGGGEHVYWLLQDPVSLAAPDAIVGFERRLRGLAATLGGDPTCCEAARVLRVPGTANYPNADKRAKGRVPSLCVALRGLR